METQLSKEMLALYEACQPKKAELEAGILNALRMIMQPGEVYEMRIPKGEKGRVMAGYFSTPETLAQAVFGLKGSFPGIYLTLNPCNAAVHSRYFNRIEQYATVTTSDHDIARRSLILIDCDAERPANVSSTFEQHALALECAYNIRDGLKGLGFPYPILADSGNGAHLLYKVDLPNDDATTALVKKFLAGVSARYAMAGVKVDQSVFNAARITKLYGSMVRKGDSTPDQPHRRSGIIDAPSGLQVVPVALLELVADWAPPQQAANQTGGGSGSRKTEGPFDLEAFIKKHGLKTGGKLDMRGGGHKWILEACPMNPDHSGGCAVIIQQTNGALAFKCHHNSCTGIRWVTLREHLEPGYKKGKARQSGSDEGLSLNEKIKLELLSKHHFARDKSETLFLYKDGVYDSEGGAFTVRQMAEKLCSEWGAKWNPAVGFAAIESVKLNSPVIWDVPPSDEINLLNGILNTRTRVKRDHDPAFLSSIRIPISYDPHAKCPAIDAFMARVQDADTQHLLAGICGVSMIPYTSLQKAFLIVGVGSNGKGIFTGIISAFLGGSKNCSAKSLQQLSENQFSTSGVFGKIANICTDLPVAQMEDSDAFKKITAGEEVEAQFKGKDSFTFKPFARLIFSSNGFPTSKDAGNAFFRRWLVAEFVAVFTPGTEEAQDGDQVAADFDGLLNSLITPAELSGLLNRSLDELEQIRKAGGFRQSPSMKFAFSKFQQETDPVHAFLAEHVTEVPGGKYLVQQLRADYRTWCKSRHLMPLMDNGFARRVKALLAGKVVFHKTKEAENSFYVGIAPAARDDGRW
jgi:P4 family phage/plasmid primase-like protien